VLIALGTATPSARAQESPQARAQAAAVAWLAQIDAGDYAGSWAQAAEYFRGAVTEQNWVAMLTGARAPLGALRSRTLQGAQLVRSLAGAPDGSYVVMQFDTRFEKKESAVETVTFVLEPDGAWKAAGYFIR